MNRHSLVLVPVVALVLALGCSSKDPDAISVAPVPDAGVPDAAASTTPPPSGTPEAGATGPWTSTECGECTMKACERARGLCDAEPSCATHARCVEACAPGATGAPDGACLKACPATEGSAAAKARAAFDSCVRSGAPSCAACKAPAPSKLDVLTQTCGASTETNACFKCEDEKCCQTFKACVDDGDCKTVVQPCVVACGNDKACVTKCYADHPKGVAPWARRNACNFANCADACYTAAPTLDKCVACIYKGACRDPHARCIADEGCFLIEDCLKSCPDGRVDDACISKCKEPRSAESGALLDAYFACSLLSCKAECE